MKKIIYSLFLCFLSAGITSCEDDTTKDQSQITYYITFEMNGEPVMNVPVGTSFIDPGVIATEGIEDVTSKVTITGSVDTNSIGIYTLRYSAINQDGFTSSTSRTVAVYDPDVSLDISGVYTAAPGCYRYWIATGAVSSFSGFTVSITQAAPGIFYVSDYMAGYYDQGVGHGSNYAMKGYMKLNPDNTLEILTGDVAGWGDSYDYLTDGVYIPDTRTISYELGYAEAMIYYITLTK